jgi:acetyl-CoA carboxylase carboxyltransferase component
MIEGGGLGVFKPEEVGPMDVQTQNGVVDIEVADDVEAVAMAKIYLSCFQGATSSWEAGDPLKLRDLIPESRKRAYNVRNVIKAIADTDSFIELRPRFRPRHGHGTAADRRASVRRDRQQPHAYGRGD